MQEKNELTPQELPLVQRLKNALKKSREEIEYLYEMFQGMMKGPLDYGLVIKTGNLQEVPRMPRKDDFKKGVKVLIKQEMLDEYGVPFPQGKIVAVENDDVVIRSIQGGNLVVKMEDLLLQDPETEVIETITVSTGGNMYEVGKPMNLDVNNGDSVLIHPMSKGIVGKGAIEQLGMSVVVDEVLDDLYCKVNIDGREGIVIMGVVKTPITKGDNVILDTSGRIIVRNLGKENSDYNLDVELNVSWNEIGGLEDVKESIHKMVELPHKHPDIFKFYNKKPAKGVLLWGPPGCGKTLTAKAIATSITKIHGGNLTESGFIYVKGPELLTKYVGETESKIRSLFEKGRAYKKRTGSPATLFIDEADAIFLKRGSGISSDVNKTIVPMFLVEMDGLDDSAMFIILATNIPDQIDPAVFREGRIDEKLEIPRPNAKAARAILNINLQKVPCEDERKEIVEFICEEIYATELSEDISGARIAAIVEQSISEAIVRDLEKGKKSGLKIRDAQVALEKLRKREAKTTKAEIPA